MKKITLAVFLLFSLAIAAQTTPDLRPGDIILQPLRCWTCSLIELEEESIFSHMGVVLSVWPEVIIGESYGVVKKTPLHEFLAKTEPGQKNLVIRFRSEKITNYIQESSAAFLKMFEVEFEGAKYDEHFLWNNFDENDREMFYCSEMTSKFLQYYLHIDMPIKRMSFKKYHDHWLTYFHGNIPEGKWGNSPADYERSDLFYHVGEL